MHSREAIGREIHVYFPQVTVAEKKVRSAVVEGCFLQHDDDIVLLQLQGGPAPLGPEQIARQGNAPYEPYLQATCFLDAPKSI